MSETQDHPAQEGDGSEAEVPPPQQCDCSRLQRAGRRSTRGVRTLHGQTRGELPASGVDVNGMTYDRSDQRAASGTDQGTLPTSSPSIPSTSCLFRERVMATALTPGRALLSSQVPKPRFLHLSWP